MGTFDSHPALRLVRKEARTFVDQILIRRTGPRFTTWTELFALAREMGITHVDTSPLSISGFTVETPYGRTTVLNETESYLRQRFSFAHEIAHRFVEPTEKLVLRVTGLEGREAIEALCDDLAAYVLMPPHRLVADLQGRALTPTSIISLADDYAVSLQAMAIQAVKLIKAPVLVSAWAAVSGDPGKTLLKRQWWTHNISSKSGMPRYRLPESVEAPHPLALSYAGGGSGAEATFDTAIPLGRGLTKVIARSLFVRRGATPTCLVVMHLRDSGH